MGRHFRRGRLYRWPGCFRGTGRFVVFLIGALLGFVATIILFHIVDVQLEEDQRGHTSNYGSEGQAYIRWLAEEGLTRISANSKHQNYPREKVPESQYLFDRVLISCIVFSSNRRQARAVVGTWGRHCNSLDFVADFEDKFVPTTVKSSNDGQLLCRALREISVKVFRERQIRWVFLAQDTTFAVIENLRRMVAPLNSSEIHYLGHAVKKQISRWGSSASHSSLTVNVADAGIVLSQGAVLKILYALGAECRSKEEGQLEDSIAVLLNDSLVSRPDTRDDLGRARFVARPIDKLLRKGNLSPYDNFLKDSLYSSPIGHLCCSPMAVSLAGVDALEMHLWEYIIARIRVGAPASKQRGLGGAPLRDTFVPPVAVEGDAPPVLPKAPNEL